MRNAFLIGELVYLRPLERSDVPRLVEMLNDREVTRTLVLFRPLSPLGEERFLERLEERQSDVVLGIVERETDLLVGSTGLEAVDSRSRHAEFGIVIGDKTRWGRGYGTEATRLIVDFGFDTLNLHRIELEVYADNPAGRHVYEKVGFQFEGVRREHTYHAGRYWDVAIMSILRREWDARRTTPPGRTELAPAGG